MRVEVLIFGAAAGAAGADRVGVAVGDRPTVGDVVEAIRSQHPALGFAMGSARLAVNHRFADPGRVIEPGDEVALIALVCGG